MIDRTQLKRSCDLIVNDPTLISSENADGTWKTFCNVAVRLVAQSMGCNDFDAEPLADEMYDIMDQSPEWFRVDGPTAQMLANTGNLVIAARKEAGHGHVTVIYPSDKMAFSASLNKQVPWCCNVGAVPPHVNAIVSVSNAFAVALGEPTYYAWKNG